MSDPSLFSRWVSEYECAHRNPPDLRTQSCPSCGSGPLRLVFVVDQLDSASGTAAFWCECCLRGLIPLSAPVPADGKRVERGSECIPDYTLVIDE